MAAIPSVVEDGSEPGSRLYIAEHWNADETLSLRPCGYDEYKPYASRIRLGPRHASQSLEILNRHAGSEGERDAPIRQVIAETLDGSEEQR